MKGIFIKDSKFIAQDSNGKVCELEFSKDEEVEIKLDIQHDLTKFKVDGSWHKILNSKEKNLFGVNYLTIKNWIKLV